MKALRPGLSFGSWELRAVGYVAWEPWELRSTQGVSEMARRGIGGFMSTITGVYRVYRQYIMKSVISVIYLQLLKNVNCCASTVLGIFWDDWMR